MTMDTQQWSIKVLALCVSLCIPLSVIGVTAMAITHDGPTIQQAFDYFTTLIQYALPGAAAVAGLHVWTQRPSAAASSASDPTSSVVTGEGTAGA